MFKEVFISHAKEDVKFAEDLYDHLLKNGYQPWLDKKKLRPGSNWDYEIKKALRECSFVVLLLSSVSVRKRGYVQKEFRLALEYSENKLIDDIYIIPILLDECEIPDHLLKFQWIKISEDNFKESILNSLNFQREKYIATLSPAEIVMNDYFSISLDLGIHLKNLTYRCDLPSFPNNPYFDAYFINTFIQQKALELISLFRSSIIEVKDFLERDGFESYIDIGYNIRYLTEKHLSISIISESFLGGAHPTTITNTLNFSFRPDIELGLNDVVEYGNFEEFLIECINKYGDEDQKAVLIQSVNYITNYSVPFVFDNRSLELIFVNLLPRVSMSFGFLTVPINEIKWKQNISFVHSKNSDK